MFLSRLCNCCNLTGATYIPADLQCTKSLKFPGPYSFRGKWHNTSHATDDSQNLAPGPIVVAIDEPVTKNVPPGLPFKITCACHA